MSKDKVLSQVVDTLTEKPIIVNVEIKNYNWFYSLLMRFGLKKPITKVFEVKPITVGNMYRVASKSLELPEHIKQKMVLDAVLNILNEYFEQIVYIVAVGLQNNAKEPNKSLIKLIKNEFTSRDIAIVYANIIEQMDVSSFISSIILIKGADVLNVPEPGAKSVTTQA